MAMTKINRKLDVICEIIVTEHFFVFVVT